MNIIASIVALAVSSGIISGIVFRHRRLLTYIACLGTIFEAELLFLTLIQRTILTNVSGNIIYESGAFVFIITSLPFLKKFCIPHIDRSTMVHDLVVFLSCTFPILATLLIFQFNGYRDGEWIFHGFFNGDTATFASLVQKSLNTKSLVLENPFSANGELEYPTLLHSAIASVFGDLAKGESFFFILPTVTVFQIGITIPMFFLLIDILFPEPKTYELWLGVRSRTFVHAITFLVVMYILGVSWDNYIYPQGHFFLTSLFLLLIAFVTVSYRRKGSQQLLYLIPAFIISITLLFSNAVTGTAAVATILVFHFLRSQDKSRTVAERLVFAVTSLVWLLLFFLYTPGNGAFGLPSFSYTAAIDMLRLSVPIILFSAVFIRQDAGSIFLRASYVVVVLMAFGTFVFSTRDIVVANASRFLYHALLIAFPLAIPFIIQLLLWIRRELLFTSRSFGEAVSGWIAVIVAVAIVFLPFGASIASAHDNLMFQDEQRANYDTRTLLWWINDHTNPDDVILASPNEPFFIPMFTGRALVRTDYWLSSDDDVYRDVVNAFKEDSKSQTSVINISDYVIIEKDKLPMWRESLQGKEMLFMTSNYLVYRT